MILNYKTVPIFLFIVCFVSTNIFAATIYSNASGNWNNAATWVGGVIPGANDFAFIQNGHNVTVTTNQSVRQLRMFGSASTTSLIVNTGSTLTLSLYFICVGNFGGATTVDVVINGTVVTPRYLCYLEVNKSNLTVNSSGTGSLIVSKDLGFYSTGSGATYNYSVATTSANTCVLRTFSNASYSQTVNLSSKITLSGTVYSDVQGTALSANTILNMDNSGAELDLLSFTFQNKGGTVTASSTNGVFNFISGGTISNDTKITYGDINIKSGSVTLGGDVLSGKLLGDLTISAGATLNTNGNDVNISGDFINNGTLTSASGAKIIMSGTSAQSINFSSAGTISNLEIANTVGGVSITGSPISISQQVSFDAAGSTNFNTNGKLILKDNGSGMANLGNLNSHTLSGNVTCEFRTQTLSNIEYRMLTVPVTNVQLGDIDYDASTCDSCLYSYGFSGSNTPSAGGVASTYSYNNGSVSSDFNEGWTAATNVSNTISPQNGLTWYIGPGSGWGSRSAYSIDVTGAPNVGPYTISAANGSTMTFSGSGANFNWALVGNPFPSTIDYSLVTRNNVSGDSYLFKADNGGYALDNIIPPFQAFFVKVTGASPSLVFNESDKSTTQKVYQKNVKDNDEIQVKLSTSLYPHKFNYTYLRFNKGATANFDAGMDKYQFSNPYPYPNVSFKTADDTATYRYVTDPDQGHIKIPLNAHGYVSGTYELSFSNLDKINGCVILEDTYTGNSKNLTASDSLYSFILSDTATNARFVLHVYNFAKEMLTTNSSCYGENSGSNTLEFYNLGNYFTSWMDEDQQYVGGSFNASISETISDLAPGNYSIEIQSMDLNCPAVTEYFSIHEPAEIKTNFGFANQLLSFRTNKEIEFKNLSTGGIASYVWDFGDNQTSTEMNPTHSYTDAGVYDIVLTAENGNSDCNVTYKQSIEVAEATGLTELSNSSAYQLVNDNGNYWVHFNSASKFDFNYSVYDIQGKQLSTGIIESGTLIDELEMTGNGILLISVNYNDQVETIKIHK